MTNVSIPDNFYDDYSFVHDFGYSAEEEVQRVTDLLRSNDIDPTNENVLQALNHIKKISIRLKTDYSDEVEPYSRLRMSQRFVGNDAPLLIQIGTAVFLAIIGAVVSEGAKWALNRSKDKDEQEDDPLKILADKFAEDDTELVVEVKKTYKIKRKK